jgi:hypothetical protein
MPLVRVRSPSGRHRRKRGWVGAVPFRERCCLA